MSKLRSVEEVTREIVNNYDPSADDFFGSDGTQYIRTRDREIVEACKGAFAEEAWTTPGLGDGGRGLLVSRVYYRLDALLEEEGT